MSQDIASRPKSSVRFNLSCAECGGFSHPWAIADIELGDVIVSFEVTPEGNVQLPPGVEVPNFGLLGAATRKAKTLVINALERKFFAERFSSDEGEE